MSDPVFEELMWSCIDPLKIDWVLNWGYCPFVRSSSLEFLFFPRFFRMPVKNKRTGRVKTHYCFPGSCSSELAERLDYRPEPEPELDLG